MHSALRRYVVLVDFLGKALGPDYEVVLQDLSKGTNSIVAIANNQISGRVVGAPLTDLALSFVADGEYKKNDYKVNYKGVSPKNPNLRSSTLFIKDDKGQLVGMLCINFNAGKYVDICSALYSLVGENSFMEATAKKERTNKETETFSDSIADVVNKVLSTVFPDSSVPVSRLTQEEKMEVVAALDKKGVFLLKGAVSEVSGLLSCSSASIYRYLSMLRK
ncbi:MAG: PAS domain-containing protein [Sphaerochaetaceae bacterium]